LNARDDNKRPKTIITDVRGVCWASLCWVIGGGVCSVCCLPCVRGHSVQPSPNAFGLLLSLVASDRHMTEVSSEKALCSLIIIMH